MSHIVCFFSSKLECEGSYVNFISFSMKNEVCMCNISMERKLGRLPGDIKTIRLHINTNSSYEGCSKSSDPSVIPLKIVPNKNIFFVSSFM